MLTQCKCSVSEVYICFCSDWRSGDCVCVQYSEGLLKLSLHSCIEESSDATSDDTNDVILFENVAVPSTTVGETAAKTGGRRNVVDISLAHLRTELRNMFAALKNKQSTKGLTFIF